MIKEYNNIVKNKHKTKEVLLQAIKEVVNDNDYQDKLNDLNNQKLTIEQRLSKIIDMELTAMGQNGWIYLNNSFSIDNSYKAIES